MSGHCAAKPCRLEVLMGSFHEVPFLEQVTRRGASVLALLNEEYGPLPLGLAQARAPRRRGGREGGLPEEVVSTLLLRKGTVELMGLEGAGALSLGLRLMAEAIAEEPGRWLCVLDAGSTLCAPAVASLGVPLSRTLVVVPELEELPRLAVRACRSGVFTSVLVDATGLGDLGEMVVVARRLSLAAEDTGAAVILLTSARARRPQPLPVAARVLVEPGEGGVTLARVLRHRYGQLGTCAVPPPTSAAPVRFSALPSPPSSPRAGKSPAVPAPTRARGHRERTSKRQQGLV